MLILDTTFAISLEVRGSRARAVLDCADEFLVAVLFSFFNLHFCSSASTRGGATRFWDCFPAAP
jgi:hypothetical protein